MKISLIILLVFTNAVCAQNQSVGSKTKAAPDSDCKPIETGEPNAEEQKPSFPGQTRACEAKSKTAIEVTVVAEGLERPWAVEPLPNGDFLITEKPGRIRVVTSDGKIGEPLKGVLAVGQGGVTEASKLGGLPPITARGQGGLLDVALSPNFKEDQIIFWSFSEVRKDGSGTSVARGKLSEDRTKIEDVKIIFRALPSYRNGLHFGSRIAFDKNGKLYVTTGDRFDRPNRERVQTLDNHFGKVMRINPDGSIPKDNPFVNQEGAKPEIWSLGHRNLQSAVFDSEGQLWTVEHGARGGDELNLIEKGKNYGWSIVSFGQEYSGRAFSNSRTKREGYVDPVYYWDPVIAPSGMEVYNGTAIPEWNGNIFVGGLASNLLVRLVIKDKKVVGEEHLLTDRGQRIRDVKQGYDGFLYVVTDSANGELLRIAPKK
ncbi:MAG: PQQ-dependent sugar dehydrogenase [Pyrinomonadaceae bacterium]|nr:PQQ-dependent sugar dehydrogenase [Pyrinomonadaceae bacterium]